MIAWVRAVAALLTAMALVGCAAPPQGTYGAAPLYGRLALQIDGGPERSAQAISASFDLRGDARRGELHLSTALGTTLAAAFWGPGEARLVTPEGEQRFADLDALSLHAFGETLPLRALPDWLRGRPWAGAAEPALLRGIAGEIRFDDGQLQARRAAPATRLRVQLEPR